MARPVRRRKAERAILVAGEGDAVTWRPRPLVSQIDNIFFAMEATLPWSAVIMGLEQRRIICAGKRHHRRWTRWLKPKQFAPIGSDLAANVAGLAAMAQ